LLRSGGGVMRPVHRRCIARVSPRYSIVAILSLALGGCSADATRFADAPFGRGAAFEATGSLAAPPAPVGRVERQALQSAPLPPPAANAVSYHGPVPSDSPSYVAPVNSSAARASSAAEGAAFVIVARGESIETISRRYGVSAAAIRRANHITAPGALRAGQRLRIPRANYELAAARAEPNPTVPSASASPSGQAGSAEQSHVVAAGETLSSIAHKYHLSRLAIAKANNLQPNVKLKLGQRLSLPGKKPEPLRVATAGDLRSGMPAPAEATAAPPPNAPPKEAGPVVANAQAGSEDSQTKNAAQNASPSFRWPVHGRIISGFGTKTGGQQNDGINVAVPEGTPIKAAEDGVVAYAGDELKGYGNLVLVRHANGFVTAYANASDLTVKRGDPVKRGQVIAHSGQTGSVSAPQLHFEIRKGATPVDPTQFLAGT
jgi:murein DD-endopeptidase MepM/ murein hydrolase activator NlpD